MYGIIHQNENGYDSEIEGPDAQFLRLILALINYVVSII